MRGCNRIAPFTQQQHTGLRGSSVSISSVTPVHIRQHSLPDEYIAQLERVDAETDLNAEREKRNRESLLGGSNRLMVSGIPAADSKPNFLPQLIVLSFIPDRETV